MSGVEFLAQHRVHGGALHFVRHDSAATQCAMTASVFVPDEGRGGAFPALYWLSGLTCTANNFTEKAGAYRKAAELGLIVVAPDTSPRGAGVADDAAYDLGQGAGFYVDATQAPWSAHFNMESYVTRDLIGMVEANFPADPGRRGISGHSMGGHGALVLALRNPGRYRSVSAFSPIVAPSKVPWGEKAFGAYLGEDRQAWKQWDASELVRSATEKLPLLVDQGGDDEFLDGQLRPQLLQAAAVAAGHPLQLRMRPGYDHSYYFIASFIGEHIAHHARALQG